MNQKSFLIGDGKALIFPSAVSDVMDQSRVDGWMGTDAQRCLISVTRGSDVTSLMLGETLTIPLLYSFDFGSW